MEQVWMAHCTSVMSRLENLKYHEIAEAIGLSVKAIEKRMNLALTFLKKELKD